MAYSETSNPFGFVITPWVKRLLIANAAVFVLTLALPGLVPYLAFIPAEILTRPWTIATYLFVHANFWHLFFNMLGLFFFGPPLEERWGSHEFVKFYFICGLAGGVLSLLFPNQAIIGASAAVYGVLVAFAMYWPNSPIYIWGIFPIKAKWLVGGFVALTVFYTLTGGHGGVAHLAHLGGIAAAFIYLKSRLAPSAWGATPARRASGAATTRGRGFLHRARKLKVEPRSANRPTPNRRRSEPPDEVDRILDKISSGGLGSLTEDERRQLEEASRRFRST